MDIHPPHPIHSWKDFSVQLLTITAGLFIALTLEAGVEWWHHSATVREARRDLRSELADNRRSLEDDTRSVGVAIGQLQMNLDVLRDVRTNPQNHRSVDFNFHWHQLSDSAWRTARDTGALGFMRQSDVRGLAGTYGLQEKVEELADQLLLAQARAAAPLLVEKDHPTAAQVDETLERAADNLTQFETLQQILGQLGAEYAHSAEPGH